MMNFEVKRDENYSELFHGTYGLYRFDGQIYDEPCDVGIANSRVTELNIYSGEQHLVSFSDEWEFGKQYYSLYHPIVSGILKELPPVYEEYHPSIIMTKEKKKSFWGRFFK